MNRLVEKRITSTELLATLLRNETKQEKAEAMVDSIFAMSSSIYVGENGKFVTLRAKNFVGIASCNRYARHINRAAISKRNGITINAIKKNQKADKFNLGRGISIAASRLLTASEDEES